jgi:hypothetical protein
MPFFLLFSFPRKSLMVFLLDEIILETKVVLHLSFPRSRVLNYVA